MPLMRSYRYLKSTVTRKLWRSASRAAVSMASSQVGRPRMTFQMHFITRTQYLSLSPLLPTHSCRSLIRAELTLL